MPSLTWALRCALAATFIFMSVAAGARDAELTQSRAAFSHHQFGLGVHGDFGLSAARTRRFWRCGLARQAARTQALTGLAGRHTSGRPITSLQMIDSAGMRGDTWAGVREGDAVEVKWSGEWWPAAVVKIKHDARRGRVQALRVQFQEGTDNAAEEEWVEVQSGDVRLSALAAKRVYSADEAERADSESDAAFWARLPDEDMDANQRALLRELLGARLPAGRVLDLCAGSKSPLPRAFTDQLTGLAGIGAAQAALAANALLDMAVEGDLNADPTLPFGDAEFDAVVCACGMPYLSRPAEVLTEARRVLAPEGILALSWTSQPCEAKVVAGWAARSEAEQVDLVKASLLQLGFHPRSLRVDISGPTGGAKLVVVSGSPAEPPRGAPQDTVADSVDTGTLKKTLAKVSKRRRDEKRQKEQDEKPFRIVVVSPPPTTALEGVFKLPARTHNGDKIEVNGNRYVVSKLRMNYVYRGGRYRLDEKIVEVQQQGRFETNERLNSLVLQDTSAETK